MYFNPRMCKLCKEEDICIGDFCWICNDWINKMAYRRCLNSLKQEQLIDIMPNYKALLMEKAFKSSQKTRNVTKERR